MVRVPRGQTISWILQELWYIPCFANHGFVHFIPLHRNLKTENRVPIFADNTNLLTNKKHNKWPIQSNAKHNSTLWKSCKGRQSRWENYMALATFDNLLLVLLFYSQKKFLWLSFLERNKNNLENNPHEGIRTVNWNSLRHAISENHIEASKLLTLGTKCLPHKTIWLGYLGFY